MLKFTSEVRCVIRYLLMAFQLYGIQAASPSIAAIVEIKFFEKKKSGDYFKISISIIAILVPLSLVCFTMLFSKSVYALYAGDRAEVKAFASIRGLTMLYN